MKKDLLQFYKVGNVLFILLFCCGCMQQQSNIKLDIVHQSSDHMECNRVFAKNKKSITELNEILIQTGIVRQADGTATPAAIINVSGKELILKHVKSTLVNSETTEIYRGNQCKLQLQYNAVTQQNNITYLGRCEVWLQKNHTAFDVEGVRNRL